mmetsp:Transcript_60251/g.126063  ORF Transcript_60251/g.126063 Transcript_60251/m.126063 type:complete len:107 (+) Transcript_60251:1281-1601(+)
MTSVLLLRSLTEEERFWGQILDRAEMEIKVMNIRGTRMPIQKVLSLISSLLQNKICEDEMDQREQLPRQSFVRSVFGFFCISCGNPMSAMVEVSCFFTKTKICRDI